MARKTTRNLAHRKIVQCYTHYDTIEQYLMQIANLYSDHEPLIAGQIMYILEANEQIRKTLHKLKQSF